jgi:hypothetical protein
MSDEIEPLVRRAPKGAGRSSVIAIRVHDKTLTSIDAYAERNGWTRADAARALLRAGFKAEGLK